jgi:hypothetical protein
LLSEVSAIKINPPKRVRVASKIILITGTLLGGI